MKNALLFRTVLFCATFFLFLSHAQAQSDTIPKKETKPDTAQSRHLFELSFGQSILFISNSKQVDIRNQAAIVIPTNAMLFLAEFRPNHFLRVPLFFNLATESKQFLVNGQLVNEKASPTFGTGLQLRCFQVKIDSKSKLEFEAGPLASFLITKKGNTRFAPVLAGRIKILRGENFVMYMGTSYSIGIQSWGLLYGTGTTF